METRVLRMLQLGFFETFVVVYGTVSNQLNLGDSRDRLEVWVEDRLGILLGLVVAVAIGVALGIKVLDGEYSVMRK